VITFAMLAAFSRQLPSGGFRLPLPGIPVLARLARLLAVVAFLLTAWAGLAGSQDPYHNLAVTMIWVLWWVGFAFTCALAGDLWALASPLRTLYAWAERVYAALTGGRALSRGWRYPERFGAWPAVALFFAFAWAELVWRGKDVPAQLAGAMLAYAALAWAGMFLFGRERWLERGEAFAVAFGVLGRFAPLEARPGGGVSLRAPGAGLLVSEPVAPSLMVFVLLMLASVTFDGFKETPLHQGLHTALLTSGPSARFLFSLSELGLDESQVVDTALLAAFPLAFVAIYLLVCPAPRAFVLTLVPIAVAYHLAHYFSLLATAGQFVIPLASDPLGRGWDLFGTAGYKVDLGLVSPYVFWYGAVALILAGHVIAVYLAHIEALRLFADRRAALMSQVPMVALMVAYTSLSLWILAQPVVG
jgi:hypothetical protein